MHRLIHIINPVKVNETSDLFIAQPITFETMRRARQFATNEIEVHLVTTQYSEDHSYIPDFLTKSKDLDRSVLDLGNFDKKRKLPILKDILDRAVSFDANADYIIYTNTDIALLPHFYSFVNEKIKEGHDAFVINRRTISKKHTISSLYAAYSEFGIEHPGYDCFIFKKELFKKFELGNICIGAKAVGLALYLNLNFYANSFQEFDKEHLTFHIGNDRVWKTKDFKQFELHNEIEFNKCKAKLNKEFTELQVNEIIKFTQRYWNKPVVPKWKRLLINLLTKNENV